VNPARASALAISAYYFASLAAVGSFYPYFALYLTYVGLSTATATRVVAIIPFMQLVAPPLVGLVADARGARVWLLRGLTLSSTLVFVCFQLAAGNVVAVAAIATVFGLLRSPLTSLADATAFDHVRHHGGSYGQLRLWGSVGYLVLVFAGGALIEITSVRSVVWTTTAMLALGAICAWRMPAPPLQRQPGAVGAWTHMLRVPSLWLFLLSVFVAQIAAVVYDTTFAMHLERLGYSGTFIGAAIAVGVAVEVGFMARSGPILQRLGLERALALSLIVAALRWYAMAHVTGPALLLLQPLHAITFGLYWVAATALAREYAGPQAVAAGQGLLSAVLGSGSVVGNALAGKMLERYGGSGLWTRMALVAAVAALGAVIHAWTRATPRAA
jgi:MFS transporter, PPP family, 3-phenylpropionic acid transporter